MLGILSLNQLNKILPICFIFCQRSVPFHPYPLMRKILYFCQSSNAWLPRMLTASWEATWLLYVCKVFGIFSLHPGNISFLKVYFPAFPLGWATWLEPYHQQGPQHMVSVQLYRAIVPSQRYMIPQILLHTHKQDTPVSSLLWQDAAPPPEKQIVDCVHSAPYWRFSISQGFGQLVWHLRWQISGGLAPSHSFSRY